MFVSRARYDNNKNYKLFRIIFYYWYSFVISHQSFPFPPFSPAIANKHARLITMAPPAIRIKNADENLASRGGQNRKPPPAPYQHSSLPRLIGSLS